MTAAAKVTNRILDKEGGTQMTLTAEQKSKGLEYAIGQLRFEITQFWQVSLFFWGFSAAALIGYGVLFDKSKLWVFGLLASGIVGG
jgi:hypothetical protein